MRALHLLLVLAGCSQTPELLVDLKTDHVPQTEFAIVRTELLGESDDTALRTVNRPAALLEDYVAGVRVAELHDLDPGALRVRVRLIAPDGATVVAERTTRVVLENTTAITVLIARGTADCTSATDCTAAVSCVEPSCVDGTCFERAVHDRCGAGMWCSPIDGCHVLATDGGMPMTDAGTPMDAQAVDGPTPTDARTDSAIDGGAGCASCPPVYTTDRTVGGNRVLVLRDLDGDGDALDPSENVTLYSVTTGPAALDNPLSAQPDGLGNVFVLNAGPPNVLRLVDADGNGTFTASEASVFYDGPLLVSPQDIVVSPAGVVFVADASAILRLEDTSGDGDAGDSGEAATWATVPALRLARSSSGVIYTEGSYRLEDLDADGNALDPGENVFYGARAGSPTPLGVTVRGTSVYIQHRGTPNEITELRDTNGDGDAADSGEQSLFGTYDATNSVAILFDSEGTIFATDTTDGVWRLTDSDGDGAYERHLYATGFTSATSLHAGP